MSVELRLASVVVDAARLTLDLIRLDVVTPEERQRLVERVALQISELDRLGPLSLSEGRREPACQVVLTPTKEEWEAMQSAAAAAGDLKKMLIALIAQFEADLEPIVARMMTLSRWRQISEITQHFGALRKAAAQ